MPRNLKSPGTQSSAIQMRVFTSSLFEQRFKGYRCESDMPLCKWKVSWNYPYSLLEQFIVSKWILCLFPLIYLFDTLLDLIKVWCLHIVTVVAVVGGRPIHSSSRGIPAIIFNWNHLKSIIPLNPLESTNNPLKSNKNPFYSLNSTINPLKSTNNRFKSFEIN